MASEPVEQNDRINELLEQAIADERDGIGYYQRLEAVAAEPADKEVIRQIMMDDEKHKIQLEKIYENLTGKKCDIAGNVKSPGKNLIYEYETNIFCKLENVDFYKKIYAVFINREIRDMLLEIICDEFSHAQKFTYLYAKYR